MPMVAAMKESMDSTNGRKTPFLHCFFEMGDGGSLAFFQFLPTRISNGFVEGKNNRTKALMRQGYGYRNRQHLRLRILLGNVA